MTLKPFEQRHVIGAADHRPAAPEACRRWRAGQLFLQAAQDVKVGARLSKTLYQFTLQDADADELYAMAPKVLDRLKRLAELRDVATDQQMGGTTATLTIDRDAAVALRHPAAGDRRHAVRCVRAAAGRRSTSRR